MDTILIAQGREIVTGPADAWRQQVAKAPERNVPRLAFMSEAHHRVRRHAVTELVRTGQPLEPGAIARALALPPAQTEAILAELERNLVFLVRDGQGRVSWAFPVTTVPTAHRITLPGGERRFGA